MRTGICLVGLLLYVSACAPVHPTSRVQPSPAALPSYTVCRTDTGIRVDGMIDENDWQGAQPVRFVTPWSDVEKEGRQDTLARLLWDDTYLYIIYQCDDPIYQCDDPAPCLTISPLAAARHGRPVSTPAGKARG